MINNRLITITVGSSRKATNWTPQKIYISDLYVKLRIPARGTESLSEYLTYPKQKQDELKDVGGYVAGALKGERRKSGAVESRDVITLDLDNLSNGATETVLKRLETLGCSYCVYSTRKHQIGAPRLRVLLPTDRSVTADEYEPIARKAAQYIDASLTPFDPSTFEASRLMYWPSCCADSPYVYAFADKPLLCADGVLAQYADWRNLSDWPQVPGTAVNPQRLIAKQGDPLTKQGVVGAFCRSYDIPRALDELLPGLYEGSGDRLTYTGGSTTGGAVVYDGGKYLYSHHATDPCSGKLVNAFDLVRLHKYGDLDDDAQQDTPSNRMPSYKEMCSFALSLSDVSALMAQERAEEAMKDFDGVPAGDATEWMKKLDISERGVPVKTLKNIKLIIANDPRVIGKIRLNQFSGRVDVVGELPWTRPAGATWDDNDTTQMRLLVESYCGKVSKADTSDTVEAVASEHTYHPIREYLMGLTWDSIKRLDTLFVDYLGAADTAYTRAVTRKSIVAAVARVMRPGIKYDTMPVLIGAQGRHKSTMLARLGGEWFSDSMRSFDGKDAMETAQGTWINEISEMQAMERSEVNAVKAFLTKQEDYYRAAYAHFPIARPRQSVFFGTTNTKDCLRDPTGNRRFWPIDIDIIERKKNVFRDFDAERDQVWAEAVAYWRLGEGLYLDETLEEKAQEQQAQHTEESPLEGMIAELLERPVPRDWEDWDTDKRRIFLGGGLVCEGPVEPRNRICAAEILCEHMGWSQSDLLKNNRKSREVCDILRKLGWVEIGPRKLKVYGNQKCFRRGDGKK